MKRYIAFLRGINVGGNKKVEMPKLQKVFELLGFTNVSTYINSGNVIFHSDTKDFSQIETALQKTFGFEVKIVLRDAENIRKLCKKIPREWKNDTKQKTDVLFLLDAFNSKNTLDLIQPNPAVDTLEYISGAIVWNIQRSNYTKSGLKNFIGTTLYKNMTARNINTVRKLGEILSKDIAA